MPNDKKQNRLQIRISRELLERYQAYCESVCTTASDDIRRYIMAKVKEYEQK